MKFDIKIFFTTLAFLLTACYVEEEGGTGLAYEGDRIVLMGYLHPLGGEIIVSRTQNPNESFLQDEDFFLRDALVLLQTASGLVVDTFRFDEVRKIHILERIVNTNGHYQISCSAEGLPDVKSELLTFAPPASNLSADFAAEPSEEFFNERAITLAGTFPPSGFIFAAALLDVDTNSVYHHTSIYTDFEAVFLDQCGFSEEDINGFGMAWSTRCFGDDFAVEAFHNYRMDAGEPNRIGLRLGSLTEKDYRFLLSLKVDDNFFSEYFAASRLSLSQTNIAGGYGWVFTVNAEEFWLDF